jgi:hypothetical protein
VKSPFYVTITAVDQFAQLEGLDPDTDSGFETAEARILERVAHARFVCEQRNGLQRWRLSGEGRGLPRYYLLVSTRPHPHGPLPQVVEILDERAGRVGRSPK